MACKLVAHAGRFATAPESKDGTVAGGAIPLSRMPVFLPLGQAEAWMRETPAEAQAILDGFEVPPVAVYPVHTASTRRRTTILICWSRSLSRPLDEDPRAARQAGGHDGG